MTSLNSNDHQLQSSEDEPQCTAEGISEHWVPERNEETAYSNVFIILLLSSCFEKLRFSFSGHKVHDISLFAVINVELKATPLKVEIHERDHAYLTRCSYCLRSSGLGMRCQSPCAPIRNIPSTSSKGLA
jgi:hypothetical protein